MIHIYSPLTFSKKITLNHLDELYPKSLKAKMEVSLPDEIMYFRLARLTPTIK